MPTTNPDATYLRRAIQRADDNAADVTDQAEGARRLGQRRKREVYEASAAKWREEATYLRAKLTGLSRDHEAVQAALQPEPILEEDLGGTVTSVASPEDSQGPTADDHRWHDLLSGVEAAQFDENATTQAVADHAGYSKSWADRLLRVARSEGLVDAQWRLIDKFPAPTVRAKVWHLNEEGEEELARLVCLLAG